ncbi:MAG: ATP-dependent DNA helicase, partial [Thermoleophilaceae bacterium]
ADLADIDAFVASFLESGRVVPLAHDPGDLRRSEVIRLRDGRLVSAALRELRYSTPEMLEVERQVIDTALARRGRANALARPDSVERALAERPTIGSDQEAMVRRLCLERDGVQVVVGQAGTGKTFALDAAREAWRASRVQVVGTAVARAAARTLEESAGIPSTSVAALLQDLGRGGEFSLARNSVLVVDEAATLSTRELRELLQHTGRAGAKLVLVGDHRQLPEIEAGGAFRGLAIRLNAIELTDNRRQDRDRDRRKVELLRDGQVSEALEITREQGELVVVPDAERLYDRLAVDYVDAIRHGEDAIMLAARRDEVRQLNARAREYLDAGGLLGRERLVLDGGEFAAGDHVVIKRNDRQLGVANSNRGRVTAIDRRQRTLQVELVDGRRVTLDARFLDQRARRDVPSLVHGYAMTAHVAQGTTTSRAFVLGSEAIYQEWAYSAFTRARRDTRFYVCDPELHGERSHGAREPQPMERVQRAMKRSRMQEMARDVGR